VPVVRLSAVPGGRTTAAQRPRRSPCLTRAPRWTDRAADPGCTRFLIAAGAPGLVNDQFRSGCPICPILSEIHRNRHYGVAHSGQSTVENRWYVRVSARQSGQRLQDHQSHTYLMCSLIEIGRVEGGRRRRRTRDWARTVGDLVTCPVSGAPRGAPGRRNRVPAGGRASLIVSWYLGRRP